MYFLSALHADTPVKERVRFAALRLERAVAPMAASRAFTQWTVPPFCHTRDLRTLVCTRARTFQRRRKPQLQEVLAPRGNHDRKAGWAGTVN